MSTAKASFVVVAALLALGAVAEKSWAYPSPCCRVYCYTPGPAATTQAMGGAQQYRSYSYTPGRRYSYMPGGTSQFGSGSFNRPALGTSSDYRPGPEYSPRQGINSAAFKIRGL